MSAVNVGSSVPASTVAVLSSCKNRTLTRCLFMFIINYIQVPSSPAGVALRCPSCLIDSAHLVCGSGSMKLSNVRPSVCLSVRPIIRPPNAAAAAGFAAVGPGATRSIDRLLHGRAWQQMRAVSLCQLTHEAKHRLVVTALLLLGRIACAECKDAAYCYRCSVVRVCVCVCLVQPTVSHTKAAEPIEMSFGLWTRWA